MFEAMMPITGIAMLVSISLWLSMRVAASSDLAVLPLNCRRRLDWWRSNAHTVYLLTGAVGLATLALHLQLLTT